MPIAWILPMQRAILDFFMHSSSPWSAAGKFLFLLFPLLLWLGVIWSTQLSIYTLPFRSNRIKFITTLLLSWWDGARAVWLFWVGLFRLLVVLIGWLFSILRLIVKFIVEAIKQIVVAPFTMTGKMTKSFFRPGIPWVAFVTLIFWCMLEAVIFAYVLFPTISEVLMDIVGTDKPSPLVMPLLFVFLLFIIMGSFAALQALADAVQTKQVKLIIQMTIIELIVMGFEAMFLYRELVDAITPWIVQQTGVRMGIGFTMGTACMGWIAIRGMTWFLFGQFGIVPLLALIARRPVGQAGEEQKQYASDIQEIPQWWRKPIQEFKNEIEWLHRKFNELLEFLTLPILQVLAVILNFFMILLTARPIFNLPFKELKDVMDTRDILIAKNLAPKKGDQS
ncbi:hypothetical protein LCGC14_1389110 [marine sediment metagenome]|uniref:Uncharacterized protein n=1 Tax=marine sediment metagenome TaxID=412755 RepID=A0A0F9K0I3_9ZZZZ|nr:hypothetical protein [Candidatus Aminicenantes bacterium]HEB36531.1 hypothetical protein [Candidatus Aminicenantes bacterium]